MESLLWHERPDLRNPALIAAFGGWSDAQEAATGGVRFLIHELKATKFAELDPEDFYVYVRMRPIIMFDDQGRRFIRWPSNEFYYWKSDTGGSDVIFFAVMEPHLHWKSYANALVEVVEAYHASPILTVGALLDGTPHTRTPGVTGSASSPQLREVLAEAGILGVRRPSQYQGPTGISSAFTMACQDKGMEYASLWGHAPHYLQTSPNPKVSHSVIQALLKLLPLPVGLAPLRGAAERFDEEVAKAVGGNMELQAYVRRLEQQYDEGTQTQGSAPFQQPASGQSSGSGLEELPSSDVVLRDLEEFLRRQQPGDQPQGGGPQGPTGA